MADQINSVKTYKTYIALGSNLGDPSANVRQAINELSKIGKVCGCSSLYATKPWGYLDQPDFINAVIAIETNYNPHQLLTALKNLEKEMGRPDKTVRWGPRIIDLDILSIDNMRQSDTELTLPHPFMHERAFVLAPLAEIDKAYENIYLALPEHLRLQVKRL